VQWRKRLTKIDECILEEQKEQKRDDGHKVGQRRIADDGRNGKTDK